MKKIANKIIERDVQELWKKKTKHDVNWGRRDLILNVYIVLGDSGVHF